MKTILTKIVNTNSRLIMSIANSVYWKVNFYAILLSVTIFLVMEWLFIITKPSFLSLSPFIEKFIVLAVSIAFVTALLLLVSVPLVIISSLIKQNKSLRSCFVSVIPAFVLSCLVLLLIDNFTYTLFKVGIVNSTDFRKIAYLVIFVVLLVYFTCEIKKRISNIGQILSNNNNYTYIFITVILSSVIFFPFVTTTTKLELNSSKQSVNSTSPNIILLTADAVEADHLNVYGYARQTTPFLSSIIDKLVISNNYFNNSSKTTGSLTSILTSKYPTTTRVLYPPDLLRGSDSIEHLPAVLRDNGYYVAQFSVRHFGDALDLNFQDGFMEANGISVETKGLSYLLNEKFPSNTKLFLNEVEVRLTDRLKHIFFIMEMENTYVQITQTQRDYEDIEKIDQTVNLIRKHQEPVFVHIHWMGTHGPSFYPDSTAFSAGIDKATQEPWDTNLYDDAIIDLDTGIARLYNSLDESNELDNTLVVITSDHGINFSTEKRLPLILLGSDLHKPSNLPGNAQSLDVAPTILDYLNISQPNWMEGRSLLNQAKGSSLILNMGTNNMNLDETQGWIIDLNTIKPPFFQFDYINLIDCDRIYQLDLENYVWTNEKIQDYHGVCSEDDYLPTDEIRTIVIERLQKDKFEFEVSSIPAISTDWIEFVNVNNQMAETVFKNILKSGWSEPESWGTWSLGNQSNLSLPLTYLDPRDYWFVTLLVQPLVLEGHPSTSLSIDVDGRNLWSGELTQTSKIRLPLILLERQTTIDIGLFVENPESPLRLGVSGDDRLLGVGLIGYQFSK